MNGERTTGIRFTPFCIEYQHYDSLPALADAATDIYAGKVTNISFDIIDTRTGKSVKGKKANNTADLHLYTVYEVEQCNLLKSAGIYNENTGIYVLSGFEPLRIGESYLFFTVDLGGLYSHIVNQYQFAYGENYRNEISKFPEPIEPAKLPKASAQPGRNIPMPLSYEPISATCYTVQLNRLSFVHHQRAHTPFLES
ncbi:MAG: hypothetical protein GX907_04845 [Clostridiaceae bacterium]|nr:hypothetical protein [Clostridiaceae bacterium]